MKLICQYCIGLFQATRRDAATCTASCRRAKCDALDAVDVTSAMFRRETFCARRRHATGWGLLTAQDREEADVRVRVAAGLSVGSRVAYNGPGLEVEGGYYLAMWAGQEAHRMKEAA